METDKDNIAALVEKETATTLAEQQEILAIFKLVRKYVWMFLPAYILTSALFILSIYLTVVYASEFEWSTDWKVLIFPVLFIFLLVKIHPLTMRYLKGYRELKQDMVSMKKKVVTGNIRCGTIENNMFFYQLYGGSTMARPKDCFSGWKITAFEAKAEENVTLHFLTNSLLLLKAIYNNVPATIKEEKISESAVPAFSYYIISGTITEIFSGSFKVTAGKEATSHTFQKTWVRIGNDLYVWLSKDAPSIGQSIKLVIR